MRSVKWNELNWRRHPSEPEYGGNGQDALVAEMVFEHKVDWRASGYDSNSYGFVGFDRLPCYTTDFGAAGLVVMAMVGRVYRVTHAQIEAKMELRLESMDGRWLATFTGEDAMWLWAKGKCYQNPAKAICLAALRALGAEVVGEGE